MYVALERKPDSGCEIQNSANWMTGVMLRLVKGKANEANVEEMANEEDDNGIPHGCHVMMK